MAVRIKNLHVRDLGPIRELGLDFKNFNLVYGHNEKGKSYLVEFLIYSLFKSGGWNIREQIGNGKVIVGGIKDEDIEFSPSSRNKIEDYLTEKYIGIPPDFSKLLVFKSTDVELGVEKESDKVMLRRYLSHKEIFDGIKKDITNSVGEAIINEYNIEADKRAKIIKDREDLTERIKDLNDLFKRLQNEYISGGLKELQERQEELESRFKALNKAKCHLAFKINKEKEELEKKAAQIKDEEIRVVLDEVSNFNRKQSDQDKRIHRYNELKKSTENYEWLENAINEYIEYGLGEISIKPSILFFIGIIGLVILSGVFFFLDIPVISYIFLGILVFIGWLYKRKYDKYLGNLGKREELQSLKDEYNKRFNEEFSNLSKMEVKRDKMKDNYNEMIVLEKQIKDEESEISNLKWKLTKRIGDLFDKELEPNRWKKELEEKLKEKDNLKEKIENLNYKLLELNVDSSEFEREEPDIEFNENEYNNINKSKGEIEGDILIQTQKLDDLKSEICKVTRDDFSTPWMELIGNLARKREEILNDYKNITAEIIGKNFVYNIVEGLYEKEDEKIEELMESDLMSKTLKDVTTRYNKISLVDDTMIVTDSFNNFPVNMISDGATEQVFLALRIGMAKHWFKKDELFLILDDAFIHSDYNRRPKLIDKMLELAKNGWQIICFTFDDNIRNLIDKKVKNLKNEYKFLNLNEI